MALRVPNLMNSPRTQIDLQRIKQSFAKTAQQLSSGQAIVDIGDDPSGLTQVLGYQATISQNAQYVAQVNTADAQLESASTVLTTLGSDINRLLQLAEEGQGTGTTNTSQAAIAAEVDALRDNLISLGNTQVQGRYIFSGTDTTTKPFDSTGAYAGNNNDISLQVSPSVSVVTNVPGDDLYFGGAGGQGSSADLLAQVASLSAALKANNTAGVATAYNNLQAISDRINSVVADVGSRQSGIADLKSGLTSFGNTLTTLKSSIQSVNYANAAVNLTSEAMAQQATLHVMSKANQQNLFDYLG
jgi:flagellar hook-associated protein 3 FlgL